MAVRRVMVTGASGLLGSAVVAALSRDTDVLPLAGRHARGGQRGVDLADPRQVAALGDDSWDALVHCAAFRSPDYCEQNHDAALRLNAGAPVELARLARARGAPMIHISTDYVFPGTHPLYREDAPRQAVNFYGETKVRAEEGIEAEYPAATILRIGALYGVPSPEVGSPMMEEALDAVYATGVQELDDRVVRCPAWVGDVAETIRFLLGAGAGGIVHASAGETCTRYGWTQLVAAALGLSAAHLRPTDRDLSRPARRPVNSQLAVDRLRRLGGPIPRDAREVLVELAPRLRRA